jgi:acetylglutamate kinase
MKDETILIKLGGSVENDEAARAGMCQDIAKLRHMGYRVVVVHGGGKEIDGWLNKLGIKPEFHNGLRVTCKETMKVVEMVLCGKVNKDIVSLLDRNGVKSVGLCGKDNGLIEARKMKPLLCGDQMIDYGLVGEIHSINADLLSLLMEHGYLPVLAPIGKAENGSSLNINADYAAAHTAAELKVDQFVLLTDVDGIYKKYDSVHRELLSRVKVSEVKDLIEKNEISGGMIPKIKCCLNALEKGVKKVSIINGMYSNILIDTIVNHHAIGTTMVL